MADASSAAAAPPNPALEARVIAIAHELRCLVCQNQTIADSNAELAVDLRRVIREQLAAGRSEREVLDFMAARYGDFVLYRPPLKPTTALLWGGPALMVAAGGAALWFTLRRRARLPAAAFDPEPEEPHDEPRPR
jgi:cytochrome c-type biogenesis protein CcmH